MSGLTLITGGARSGKSRYAQELALRLADGCAAVFVATGSATDSEMAARIERHRKDRPAHWKTVEAPLGIVPILMATSPGEVVLVDCLTFYVTNHLLCSGDVATCDAQTWDEASVEAAVKELAEAALKCGGEVIIVTNEVGMGLVPETPLGRAFRDIAGRANQIVAQAANTVILMVAGIPVIIKSPP